MPHAQDVNIMRAVAAAKSNASDLETSLLPSATAPRGPTILCPAAPAKLAPWRTEAHTAESSDDENGD